MRKGVCVSELGGGGVQYLCGMRRDEFRGLWEARWVDGFGDLFV